MPATRPALHWGYATAAVVLLLATLLRVALQPVLGEHFPFLIYLGAVAFVARYAGTGPAILTAAGGGLLAAHFFGLPLGHVGSWANAGPIALYGVVAGTIIALARSLATSKLRAVTDLTERLRAEEAADAKEREFQAIFDLAGAGVVQTDAIDRRLLRVNQYFCDLLGYSETELLARTLCDITHPEDVERDLKAVRRIMAGEIDGVEAETRYLRKDGQLVWGLVSVRVVRDASGSPLRSIAVVFDITERKRIEGELHRNKEFLERIMDSSEDCIKVLDLEGRVLFMSAAGQRRLEIPDPSCILTSDWLDLWCGPAREAAQAALHAARNGRVGSFQAYCPTWTGGSKCWDTVVTPMRGADGTPERLLAVSRDVTEHRKFEAALNETAERLAEADRRKDQFLATLAHELRNPLTPIRNALTLIRMRADDPAAVEDARRLADRQLSQLVRLVDDLLDVSRITCGKLRLQKGRIDIRMVIDNALETAAPLFEAAGHRLTIDVESSTCHLEGDPIRLAQALSNLLTNAAKYTEPGGEIRLSARCTGGEITIAVEDNGRGIHEPMLPKLFELFTQIDSTTGRASEGLGIGLSLVKSLVELHGGTVEAASAGPGKGSTFTMRLPLCVAEARGEPPCDPQSECPTCTVDKRILVVDDNVDAADSLAAVLRLSGRDVQTAYDGPSAIALAREHRPEVVLLDLGMPGMSGYQVAEEMRRQPALQDVLLIALTGWGQEQDRVRTREAGFDHHLTKPPDLEHLEALLRGAVQVRATERKDLAGA
jgi:PAS domain S-box-containing protein